MKSLKLLPAAVALAIAGAPAAHASCGAAFCMVNTNWDTQGVTVERGLRLDLRFEYIGQDQPMSGSRKIAVGENPRHHDEVKSINRNYVGTLDYNFNERWGVSASVPYVDRSHFHIHNHRGAQVPERWEFAELGDVRVVGRYQWRSENAQAQQLNFYGINFGLKLPTGQTDVTNAQAERAERTLQPGTGTTDIVLGAFFSQILGGSNSSWFAQTLWQKPLNVAENYKPGQRVTFDLGYRYAATDAFSLMLQVNTLARGRDRGPQAEPDDTGGRFVFVSPGASYAVTRAVQVYAFVQKPIYQHVNGVQLTADWSAAVGVSARY